MGGERILGTCLEHVVTICQEYYRYAHTKEKSDSGTYQKEKEKLEETIIQIEYSAEMLHNENYRVVEP